MDAYVQALKRDPSAATAAINLAGLKAGTGDVNGAIELIERVCRLRPGDRGLRIAVHDLLAGMNRLAVAAAMWSDALRREPRAADLMAWYAWTSALAEQWVPARSAAERALAGGSTKQGEPEVQSLALAASVLADVAEGNPQGMDGRLEQFLSAAQNPPDSRTRLRAAISDFGMRHPDDPWPYYVAGRLLLADGQSSAARMALQEFLNLSTDETWKARVRTMVSEP